MFCVREKPLIYKNKLLLTRKKSSVTKIDKIRGCALPSQKKSGNSKIATSFNHVSGSRLLFPVISYYIAYRLIKARNEN